MKFCYLECDALQSRQTAGVSWLLWKIRHVQIGCCCILGTRLTIGRKKPCSSKILFCILLNVQSCSGGPSLAPTEGVTALLSSGVKRPGREFDLPTADMNGWICSSAPSIYLGSVDNDGFSFAIDLLTLFHLTLRIKTDQRRFFAFSTISRPCSHL